MKVAYLVGSFPAPSQTFVANQIFGVEKCGNKVSVFTCDYPDKNPPAASNANRIGIQISSICPPRNYVTRLFKVIGLMFICGWRSPRVVARSLNVFQHGRSAISLWLLHAALTLVRLGERKYDIVHAQFGMYGHYAMKLIQVGAIDGALVTSFRGYDATTDLRVDSRAYAVLFKSGRLFLPVSESMAGKLIGAGCDPSKIHILHSGIDCEKLPYAEPRRIGGRPVRLVTIGRFVEKKGVRYALEAVARVIASGRDIVYTVIGDGPLCGEIERLIEEYGIDSRVELLGWKSHREALSIMRSSNILITPSITAGDGDEEGIPNVIKEAMAVGLPVISTKHAGIPELVTDGESGFLVPERRADLLAERINYLYDHPEAVPPITRAARNMVEAEFEIRRLTDDLLACYAGLVVRVGDQAPRANPAAASAAIPRIPMDSDGGGDGLGRPKRRSRDR